jgi:hypothetical protein
VVHAGGHDGVEGAREVVVGLPRCPVDHVEVDVLEARPSRLGDRLLRAARGVDPVQDAQDVGGGGLHAQGDPGVPALPQPVEELRRRGLRVALGGHLGAGGESEGRPDAVEHPHQDVRTDEGRRPPADEDRVDRGRGSGPGEDRRGALDLQGGGPFPVGGRGGRTELARRVGVEVAVAAAGRAERDVQIDPERGVRITLRWGQREPDGVVGPGGHA